MRKIFTLLIAFVAMATGMQATDYGFSICGNAITSDNYQSQSSGKAWSYDPATNVLHLKDGTINYYNGRAAISIKGNVNSTLKVSVDGNCTLNGNFNFGIEIGGNGTHTFYGTGKLSIKSDQVRYIGIASEENGSSPNVIFKDLTVDITSYGGYGFDVSYFASIIFDYCDFNITTGDGWAMKGDAGSCKPQLILCNSDHDHWYSYEGGCGYTAKTNEDGLWASNLKISRCIKYVGVNVAEPVPGQKPATTATTISYGYKVTSIEWKKKQYGNFYSYMEENEVFEKGQTYQVIFRIEAQGDSLFNYDDASKAAMIFTTNGNSPSYFTINTLKNAYMEYTFPELVGTKYDLWVGGTQVNDANKEDVLGNGKVTYAPATKTLSLKSASIHGQGRATDAATGYGAGIYSEVDGLTIDVAKGGVEVIGADDCHGIYLRGKTTIKGEGTISGKGYIGVFMGSNSADLTVDGNVMLQAEGTTSLGLGGYVRGFAGKINYYTTLTIKGTSIVLANGVLKSIGDWNDLVLEDNHAITSPTGAVWNADKHAVCDASGNPIAGEWVVIKRLGALKGDVNLDGDVTIADGVAVLNAMAGQSVPGNPDINGDNDITIADFVAVLNIMAGQ